MAHDVFVGVARDDVAHRVDTGCVVARLVLVPRSTSHARVILHMHVRAADDRIAMRVGLCILVASVVGHTGRARHARVVLNSLVRQAKHVVTRLGTAGSVARAPLKRSLLTVPDAVPKYVTQRISESFSARRRSQSRRRRETRTLFTTGCFASDVQLGNVSLRLALRINVKAKLPAFANLDGGLETPASNLFHLLSRIEAKSRVHALCDKLGSNVVEIVSRLDEVQRVQRRATGFESKDLLYALFRPERRHVKVRQPANLRIRIFRRIRRPRHRCGSQRNLPPGCRRRRTRGVQMSILRGGCLRRRRSERRKEEHTDRRERPFSWCYLPHHRLRRRLLVRRRHAPGFPAVIFPRPVRSNRQQRRPLSSRSSRRHPSALNSLSLAQPRRPFAFSASLSPTGSRRRRRREVLRETRIDRVTLSLTTNRSNERTNERTNATRRHLATRRKINGR